MKKTLLVMAAGMGSRFGGLKQIRRFTDSQKTLLDYALEDALAAGFTKAVFVIRRDIEADFKAAVSSLWEGRMEICHAYQELDSLPQGCNVPEGRSKPWGTGHAVLCAKNLIAGPFAVINADDYYGPSAYETVAKFMDSEQGERRFALVGYKLGNTLSENGGVSRGVCMTDKHSMLLKVQERTGLKSVPGGVIDSEGSVYSPDTLVSMNFWAFNPSLFEVLEKSFEEFLRTGGAGTSSEFYLPMAVDGAVETGEASVLVIPTDEKWHGVTYPDDAPALERFLQSQGR